MDTLEMLGVNTLWATGVLAALAVWILKREEVRDEKSEKLQRERKKLIEESKETMDRGMTF